MGRFDWGEEVRVRVAAEGDNSSSGYPYPNDTVVKAVLDSIEAKTLQWTDRETGAPKSAQRWEWRFTTEDGAMVKGLTPAVLRGNNQTRMWCESLVGPMQDGFEFDTNSLVGLSCMVKLQQRKPFTGRTGKKFYPMDVVELQPDKTATNVF